MGGNALKHLGVERIDAQTYHSLIDEILGKLADVVVRAEVIPAYRNKESFGDMDILIIPEQGNDLRLLLIDCLNPREIIHNGDCYSLDYKNFQIDIIVSNEEEFDYSLGYFSYNDLGNLMGRIAHKFGLKHGHAGLQLIVRRNNTHVIGEINVTQSHNEAMEFLGYSVERFDQGFDTLEEIFEFAASTQYFNKEIYNYESLNHINRTRNRKRESYREFLKWLENKHGLNNYQFVNDKNFYLPNIFAYFPKAQQEYYNLLQMEEKRLAVQNKFNGDIVKKLLPELRGKELGKFIQRFKKQYIGFDEWVINSSPEEIQDQILLTYQFGTTLCSNNN